MTFEPATPEYALAVLRDSHRSYWQFGVGFDPPTFLELHTTVAEWRDACDLDELSYHRLGNWFNKQFGIHCSRAEWKATLQPETERTLADVCLWISERAMQPRIHAARILGASCKKAGAFFAIRTILAEDGADVSQIAPSTPLADYTRRYLHSFTGRISRLAPGSLPAARVRSSLHEFAFHTLLTCIAGLIVGYAGSYWILMAVSQILLYVNLLFWFLVVPYTRPTTATLGELRTFRELATLIAGATDKR